MLTSVGRAAARRVQTTRLSSSINIPAQLLCRQSAATSTLLVRSFSVSAWPRLPAAGDKKTAKKTTTTASNKKATGTTKSKATKTKAKPKPKPKAKPKAAAEKPKKKPKKEVDPEKLKKAEIREVKKWALKDKLSKLPATSWNLYVFEQGGNYQGSRGLTQQVTGLAEKFGRLDESELKDLENRASANRKQNIENLKAWVESHEPARIYLANKARRRLEFLTGKQHRKISDERLPRHPASSYALFVTENYSRFSDAGRHIAFKDMAQGWAELSSAEKARYEERAAEQSVKYRAEMEKVEARAKVIRDTKAA